MTNPIVTEIVEFKTAPGMADDQFITIVNALEENFHSRQSGFIDTELIKGRQAGHWFMIQHWRTMDEAKQAVQMMMKSPLTREFRQVVDPASVKMALLEQVKTWGTPR